MPAAAGTLLLAFTLACTSGDAVPTATPPAPTFTSLVTQPAQTPDDPGPPHVEEERILRHIRVLAEDIGVRAAGSLAEQEAIDYAGGSFERWGYDVELQSFTASGPLLRETALEIDGPDERSIPAMAFVGAAATEGSGQLLDAGTGLADEFPADADGAVLLIQRRDVTFVEMARRAEAAGASGVIVANREPGRFLGVLDPASDLPVAGIDRADGEALRALLADGAVDVRLDIEDRVVTAHNIVARPEGGTCRTLTGGHYDTVPWAAGANDNASGAAVVLELARASAAAGLSGNCFALWGAEEEGLLGSAFFVSTLSEGEREGLEAVFNYDVVGSEDPPVLIGSIALIDAAEALDDDLDVRFSVGTLPDGAGSDHESFIDAGIPALMVTTPGFGVIHTAQDTVENLDESFVDAVAMLGFALLREPPNGN